MVALASDVNDRLEPDRVLPLGDKDSAQSRKITLTNASQGRVAFNVKTTAPESYLVRPSQGTLRVGESKAIIVTWLPAGPSDMQLFLRCK